MNFVNVFKAGQDGSNVGLPLGLKPLHDNLNGLQRASLYGIAGAPKSGKSTLVDDSFLLSPFCYKLTHPDLDIEWLYFSYEISRVRKEFRLVPYFFSRFYKMNSFIHKGADYRISSNYLLGKLVDEDGELIKVKSEHVEILKEIYKLYIVPLFGEYDNKGKRIQKGLMTFYDTRENPTGIYKILEQHAAKNGTFIEEEFTVLENGKSVKKKVKVGYKPNNPNKYTIVILDHLRKLKRERGFDERETINKMVEYQVDLRNLCGYTFVDIIHLNRNISDVDRLKFAKETIYPTGDDVKGTGNLSEEADFLITLFNPGDEKYGLTTHFGVDISKYKNYRSIHLVESRDTECPRHFGGVMDSESSSFKRIVV